MRTLVGVGALACCVSLVVADVGRAAEDPRALASETVRRPPTAGLARAARGGSVYDVTDTFEQYEFGANGFLFDPPYLLSWIANFTASAVHLDPSAPAPVALSLATGDVTGDGLVSMADLGLVVGAFGAMGGTSDVNGDGVVNTADIGLVLRYFGRTIETIEEGSLGWCVHTVDAVDQPGGPLAPGSIVVLPDDGACFGQREFVLRDIDTGQMQGTGRWTLKGLGVTPAPGGAFNGCVAVTGEENQCLVMLPAGEGGGGASLFAQGELSDLLAPAPGEPIVVQADLYLASHARMVWFDSRSVCEGFTAMRVFLGGTFDEFGPDFIPFLNDQLEVERFTFLASRPGLITSGVIYGTGEDASVGAKGKRVLLNEWFQLQFRQHEDSIEVWVRDSETKQLPPGTPWTEDGFARLFPAGPYGPAIGPDKGDVAVDPQPLVAASSITGVRVFSNSRVNDPWAIDNVRISGPVLPPADAPPLPAALDFGETYADGLEGYHLGPLSRQSCDTWFESAMARTRVVDDPVWAGSRAAMQVNKTGDFIYRSMFRTFTPSFFEFDGQDVVYRCRMRLSDCRTLRAFTIVDRNLFENVSLLTGFYDEFGNIAVDGDGLSEFWVYDWFTGTPIPTGVRVPALDEWFECEILLRGFADPFYSPPAHMEVRVNGAALYDGPWTNTYGGTISFDSDNHPAGIGSTIHVDDVSVSTGFSPFPEP